MKKIVAAIVTAILVVTSVMGAFTSITTAAPGNGVVHSVAERVATMGAEKSQASLVKRAAQAIASKADAVKLSTDKIGAVTVMEFKRFEVDDAGTTLARASHAASRTFTQVWKAGWRALPRPTWPPTPLSVM